MSIFEPAGIRVDPAIVLAHADRQQRRARALAAAVVKDAERRAALEACTRAAVAAYLAEKRPSLIDRVVQLFAPTRPVL